MVELEISRVQSEQRDGEDQRYGASFEKRKHEENSSAACRSRIVREDHDGAAEAHGLPGDQEGGAVLQAEHAQRAKQAERGAEQPASPAAGRGGSEGAGEYRRDETEAHQPQSLRRDAEIHDFRSEPAGKRYSLARIRKARDSRGHADGGADRKRDTTEREDAAEGEDRSGEPQSDGDEHERVSHRSALRSRAAGRDRGTSTRHA